MVTGSITNASGPTASSKNFAKKERNRLGLRRPQWLLAGAAAQIAVYLMDLVKTRLQTCVSELGKTPKLWKLTKDIWIQEGPRASYKGLCPSLIGIVPYAGIDLAA